MSVYDRLSGDKKSPPESRKHRRELQFGRYDYHVDEVPSSQDQQQQQQQKRSAADVDAIVQRLRQDARQNDSQQQQQPPKHSHRTVNEAEAREIFSRLQQCDFSRWPVESRVGRHELGQNRYDFYRGDSSDSNGSRKPASVSKAELETIVGRLSAYDVAKTPPNSRAQEIKQAKAAGGAA